MEPSATAQALSGNLEIRSRNAQKTDSLYNPTAVTNAGGLGVLGGVGYTPRFLKQQIDEIKEALNDKNAPFGIDLLLPQVRHPGPHELVHGVHGFVQYCDSRLIERLPVAFLQVGGSARATNKDYTNGQLPELIDIIIQEKAALFVCVSVRARDSLRALLTPVPPARVYTRRLSAFLPSGLSTSSTKLASRACESCARVIAFLSLIELDALNRNMVGAAKHCKKALDVGMDMICAQGGEGGGHTGA